MRRCFWLSSLALMLSVCGAACLAAARSLWIDVPFVRQQHDGCGAASIAMVMQYWQQREGQAANAHADPAEILRMLYVDKAHGIYASDMARYFQNNGYRTFTFAGRWDDVEREVQYGHPLIAALKPLTGRALHYVVVVGFDDGQQVVLLNDPAQRKLLKEDRARFEREWQATHNWTLLAVPAPRAH